jgi:hypothetical protein
MFNLGSLGSLGTGYFEGSRQADEDAINQLKRQQAIADWSADPLITNLTQSDLANLSQNFQMPQSPQAPAPPWRQPVQTAALAPPPGAASTPQYAQPSPAPGTMNLTDTQIGGPTPVAPPAGGATAYAGGDAMTGASPGATPVPTQQVVSPELAARRREIAAQLVQGKLPDNLGQPPQQQAAQQQQPGGLGAGGGQQQGGQQQGQGGGMQLAPDLGRVLALLKQRNPQASPQAIISAATKLNKLLNPESRMQLQYMNMLMRQQSLEEQRWRDRQQYGDGGGAAGSTSLVDAIGNYQIGPLPLGGRNAAQNKAIMDAVLQKYPGYDATKYAGKLTTARIADAADARAASGTLTKLVTQRGLVGSFEKLAVKNGRSLVALAKKLDDTGMPVIDRWLRAGRQAVAGDADVSEFNAQMLTFRTEAARILMNPNLTGPLTDAARHEVEEVLPQASNPEQIERVFNRLQTDFANRNEALDESIVDTRRSLKDWRSEGGETGGGARGGGGAQQGSGDSGQPVPMGGGWSVQTQ